MFGNLFKSTKNYEDLSSTDFENGFKNDPNAVLLDVRTVAEHKSGHIPNSKNIDVMSFSFGKSVEKLDKSKSYYVYCRSGGRSGNACNSMSKLGFEKVYNLRGGMMGWHGDVK